MSRRLLLIGRACPLLGLLLALLIVPAGALAAPPTREPLPEPQFPVEGICSFPVQTTTLMNKEKLTTFYGKDGEVVRQLLSGALKVRLTNLATGSAVDVTIAGPGQITAQPDGSLTIVARGRGLLALRQGIDVAPAGQWLAIGRVVFTVSPTGAITTIISEQGHQVDLCAALAS